MAAVDEEPPLSATRDLNQLVTAGLLDPVGQTRSWGDFAGSTGVASKTRSHGGWAPRAGSGDAMFLATARPFFGPGGVSRCVWVQGPVGPWFPGGVVAPPIAPIPSEEG